MVLRCSRRFSFVLQLKKFVDFLIRVSGNMIDLLIVDLNILAFYDNV